MSNFIQMSGSSLTGSEGATGYSVGAAEFSLLEAITSTAAEINYLDIDDLAKADLQKLADITATAAEINDLTSNAVDASDLTKLSNVSATAAELNYLDNDDLESADFVKLAAVTANATELNYTDVTTLGTAQASKAVTVDASSKITLGAVEIEGSAFDIDGGTADALVIGGSTPAAASVTTLGASGASTLAAASFSGAIDANSTSDFQGDMNLQAAIAVAGSATLAAASFSGAIDANSTSDFQGDMNLQAALAVAGAATMAAVTATTVSGSGAASLASLHCDSVNLDGGVIDGVVIGGATPAAASVTTLGASGASTLAAASFSGAIDANSTSDFQGDMNLQAALAVAGASTLAAVNASGVVDISDTTDASDASGDTGALRCEGGASIAKKLYVGTDLDVDGTANLDIVDIDGAVDMATTLAVAGAATLAGASFSGAIDANSTSDFQGAMNLQAGITIAGAIDANSTSDFQGDMNLQAALAVAGASTMASVAVSGVAGFAGGYGSSGVSINADGDLLANGDLTVDGAANFGAANGYAGDGVSVSAVGAVSMKGALTVGASGAGVDAIMYGAAAGESWAYSAANNVVSHLDSSGNAIYTLGGDASSEYALDVADGASNINKVRAGAFVTYSDRNLKTEIAPMSDSLKKVMKLDAVSYKLKSGGTEAPREIGFLAQEVAAVVPEVCAFDAKGESRGIDYSRMSTLLAGALKAQQEQIAQLKEIVAKLQK